MKKTNTTTPSSSKKKEASLAKSNNNNSKKSSIWASRFKTKVCEKFSETGDCPYTHRCMFAHGESESRTKEMNFRDGLITEESIKKFQYNKHQQALHTASSSATETVVNPTHEAEEVDAEDGRGKEGSDASPLLIINTPREQEEGEEDPASLPEDTKSPHSPPIGSGEEEGKVSPTTITLLDLAAATGSSSSRTTTPSQVPLCSSLIAASSSGGDGGWRGGRGGSHRRPSASSPATPEQDDENGVSSSSSALPHYAAGGSGMRHGSSSSNIFHLKCTGPFPLANLSDSQRSVFTTAPCSARSSAGSNSLRESMSPKPTPAGSQGPFGASSSDESTLSHRHPHIQQRIQDPQQHQQQQQQQQQHGGSTETPQIRVRYQPMQRGLMQSRQSSVTANSDGTCQRQPHEQSSHSATPLVTPTTRQSGSPVSSGFPSAAQGQRTRGSAYHSHSPYTPGGSVPTPQSHSPVRVVVGVTRPHHQGQGSNVGGPPPPLMTSPPSSAVTPSQVPPFNGRREVDPQQQYSKNELLGDYSKQAGVNPKNTSSNNISSRGAGAFWQNQPPSQLMTSNSPQPSFVGSTPLQQQHQQQQRGPPLVLPSTPPQYSSPMHHHHQQQQQQQQQQYSPNSV